VATERCLGGVAQHFATSRALEDGQEGSMNV
jgi:hypothetical protein